MSSRAYNSVTLGVQSSSLFVFLHCFPRHHLYLNREFEAFYFDCYEFLRSLNAQKESEDVFFQLCYAVLPYTVLCYVLLRCALLLYSVLRCGSFSMLCCAMLCCAMLCCAMLCYALLCCALLHRLSCAALRLFCYAVLCCAILCYALMFCAVLHRDILCCAMLCCAMLCCAMLC